MICLSILSICYVIVLMENDFIKFIVEFIDAYLNILEHFTSIFS